MKKIVYTLFFIILIIPSVSAENYISKNFADYGIQRIGIYTETYDDIRSDNFVFEITAIRSNGILQDPRYFRYRYCNYDLVTPPLTTRGYPLNKNEKALDRLITDKIDDYLRAQGWQTAGIEGFTEGKLKDLLKTAENQNLDAVLLVRCTPLTYILPIENYAEKNRAGASTADTGKIKKGRGLFPAVELYDTATGRRLWYSAYHTGHSVLTKKENYQHYVEEADSFFVQTNKDEDIKAIERMISLTLQNDEAPFPEASAAGERSAGAADCTGLRNFLWTASPSYRIYGNRIGIGYSFDYIGEYDILYKDSFEGTYPGGTPVEKAGTIPNAAMHRVHIPVYSAATHNLAIEPSLYLGILPPWGLNVEYTDIRDDYHGGYTELPATDIAYLTATTAGLTLSIKYFLRFSDNFTAFIGGTGSAAFWWQQVQLYSNENDAGGFFSNPACLYTEPVTGLLINASLAAGFKWESKHPFEIYGEVTPLGPGGGLMYSAGLRLIPATWGFIPPHSTNVSTGTKGF